MTKAKAAHPHDKPHHPHWPLASLLFLFVLLLGLFSVHEPGTWLHIRTGAQILADRALPRVDAFSYTVAGRPWTTDSWLADVVFRHLDASAGPWGLIALKAVVAAAAFALLLPLSAGSPLLAASTLGLGALAAWPGLTEMPAIFDLLMLSLLIRALRPRADFHWGLVGQVALVELLWANLHGPTALVGVWVVALKTFKATLRAERLQYAALLGAAAAAFLVNPHGGALLTRFFADMSSSSGWQPRSWLNLYALFALAGGASCWVCLQQEFFLSSAAASLLALSIVVPDLRPLYVLAACPVIALALGHFARPRPDTPARVARWAAAAALVFAAHYVWSYVPLGGARGYGAVGLEGALSYLKANGVSGRMFNEAETGEALIAAGRPVFVDGRSALYGQAFVRDAALWPVLWPRLSDVYGFDYALILNRRAAYPARTLDADPDWRLAYADDEALVYLKRAGPNGWLVAGTSKRVVEPNRLWPESLEAPLAAPARRARTIEELDRWIAQAPDSVQALLWKAYALDRLRLPEKAARLLAVARERPRLARDPELQACLALILERRGETAEARRLYHRAALFARRAGSRDLEAEVLRRLAPLDRGAGEETRARGEEDRVRALVAPQ